ncbi:MAG: hypothetical protein DRO99_04275 [Candidatus Aenigmatarchaeota archaeon]|nr:MAG: hypothetical protein DRO99_04275 [Candidatus Aenigmarchaeota archaeon]
MHPILLFIIFIAFIGIAYKVFKALIKAVVIGIVAALFPFFANYIGVAMPTDINTMMWFGTFGVLFFIVYKIVHGFLSAGSSIVSGGDKGRIRREARKEIRRQMEKEKNKD